jgi:hypothetical protein
MDMFFDILKITIPALIVFLTAWILLRNMIRNDQNKRRHEIIMLNSKTVIPIRLQAYERIVLFLERTSFESLLIRTNSPGMTARELHSALLNTIRSEFEHNLSQQIYMSQQAWEVVKNAKSNTVKIINTEFENTPNTASGLEFSQKLLEKVMNLEKEPTKTAVEYIKNEVGQLM